LLDGRARFSRRLEALSVLEALEPSKPLDVVVDPVGHALAGRAEPACFERRATGAMARPFHLTS